MDNLYDFARVTCEEFYPHEPIHLNVTDTNVTAEPHGPNTIEARVLVHGYPTETSFVRKQARQAMGDEKLDEIFARNLAQDTSLVLRIARMPRLLLRSVADIQGHVIIVPASVARALQVQSQDILALTKDIP
jgi:hypothetical protein